MQVLQNNESVASFSILWLNYFESKTGFEILLGFSRKNFIDPLSLSGPSLGAGIWS
jgi:dihydropteroate synthase